MEYSTAEEIVSSYIDFRFGESASGWKHVYCEVPTCMDGSRTKGPRGNWLFEDDVLFYNCFNCGISGNFSPSREFPFSENMRHIFKSFGVPLNHLYKLIKNNGGEIKTVERPKLKFEVIDQPDFFLPLMEASEDNPTANLAKKHLIEERMINPESQKFFISTGTTKSKNPADSALAKSMLNRLIIPAYMGEKLIGYEAMALGNQSKKYIRIGNNFIHGYNRIYGNGKMKNLFITEGFFDSEVVDGVAVLSNKLSKSHIDFFNGLPHQKVVIPDRNNDHNALAETAIELGWGVSCPDIRPCKDLSKAKVRFGSLYVAKSVMESIRYGKKAKISLKIYNRA